MDALTLLKQDHDLVKKLLAEGEETTERAAKTRTELFARLKSELTIHEQIEETILYPALRDNPKAEEIAYEAYEEHHVVDTILSELEMTPTDSPEWLAKFTVAKENLEHHIEEEEGEMFTKTRQIFSDDELEEMGRRMAEVKSAAKELAAAPAG
jgi:hypothetical protein